ncbi:MAG: SdiA-regulated domain-containing protein [Bacteroidetes bacterium]|nr:SdiA-regulated domain-containing protein [Bacteroidota bacterium]
MTLTNKLFRYPIKWVYLFLTAFLACRSAASGGRNGAPAEPFPYDLENPSLTINFPAEELREISGLSYADSSGLFCAISDERGEIMFVQGELGGKITRRILFRSKGDFEGLEMVGNALFALKSDGKLFEIENWRKPEHLNVKEYNTGLKKEDDLEGLGYDPHKNLLLLASKGDPTQDSIRKVYGFNLKTKQLNPAPIYTIDPKAVIALVPYALDEKMHHFSPSGIAVHPKTHDVYVISTALKRLVVLDHDSGGIRHAARLNKSLMPQPEGIAFDPAGNLFLSSEGKKNEGLMLKFNYKK